LINDVLAELIEYLDENMGHSYKADNMKITKEYLEKRAKFSTNLGYTKQKWIEFCEVLLSEGYSLTLYEAKQTYSKYITVHNKHHTKAFKVRFSNHKPIEAKELAGSCDFFVGVTNLTVTNTNMALDAVRKHFSE
jgi:hypothetical protein